MAKRGKRYGYIRTSTDRQSPGRQLDGLRDVCDEVFIEEGVSATSKHRPVFEAVLAKLNSGDTLVVWDVDRAFRCASEALTQVDQLRARGVHFEAVGWDYDFETPEGVFNFTIRAACAELETGIMSKRIRQGIAAAKKRGVVFGRPRKLSDSDVQSIRASLEGRTVTIKALARNYGVAPRTISRALVRA